jgi:hypothetical protein
VKPDLADPSISRMVVTGHPNHELAIFGFVQRMRPRLLFLTDGGGPEREGESRAALASIGLLERARFLSWSEQSLYDALLAHDFALFRRLAAEVRGELLAHDVRQVFCESIELYNPLHDITLPVVRAAAAELDVEIVEFPLIAQEPSDEGEHYRVQRFPDTRDTVSMTLDAAEGANKLDARDRHYTILGRTMGDVLARVPDPTTATEFFRPARPDLPEPGVAHVLRYEWRAQLLRDRGAIQQTITFREHFLPFVAAMSGSPPPTPGGL